MSGDLSHNFFDLMNGLTIKPTEIDVYVEYAIYIFNPSLSFDHNYILVVMGWEYI